MARRLPYLIPIALLVASLAAVAPPAAGHAALDVLDVETQLLADEGEDAFLYLEGYDLWDLYARDAYWAAEDARGVIFRFSLYGGHAAAAPSDEPLAIEIGTADADVPPVRIVTEDDETWTGDGTFVYLDAQAEEPPYAGYTTHIQLFVPHALLGLEPGGTLEGVWMRSYAGGEVVDVAPGGYYLPGSGGAAEVPPVHSESERLVDAYELRDPVGYVAHEAAADGANVTLQVRNILDAGQHVTIVPADRPGWTVQLQGPAQASLDAGANATFDLTATPGEAAGEIPIALVTDLGGRSWATLQPGPDGTAVVAGGNGSLRALDSGGAVDDTAVPVPPWAVLVAILGAAAAGGRRRGS